MTSIDIEFPRRCRLGIAAQSNVPVGNNADEFVTFDNRYEADRKLAHAMRQLANRRFRPGGLDLTYQELADLHAVITGQNWGGRTASGWTEVTPLHLSVVGKSQSPLGGIRY